MSDQNPSQAFPSPPSMPPPPPPNAPPPVYQAPAYPPPPPVPYQASQPGYAYPGQVPPPINPTAAVFGISGGILSQFGGYAAWSIGFGLVSIIVPFATNWYFPIMPIIGAINGIRAIQRGRMVGGLVGIGLNIVGGLVSLVASGILLGGGS